MVLGIQDRSILVRFHPEGIGLPRQTFCHVGDTWHWLNDDEMREMNVEPFVFDTREDADAAGKLHLYAANWSDQPCKPWAVVRGNPIAEAERHRRWMERDQSVEASARPVRPEPSFETGGRAPVRRRKRHVAPSECYRMTCEHQGERAE